MTTETHNLIQSRAKQEIVVSTHELAARRTHNTHTRETSVNYSGEYCIIPSNKSNQKSRIFSTLPLTPPSPPIKTVDQLDRACLFRACFSRAKHHAFTYLRLLCPCPARAGQALHSGCRFAFKARIKTQDDGLTTTIKQQQKQQTKNWIAGQRHTTRYYHTLRVSEV